MPKINILILSPDPGAQGGVVNFNELLKSRFSDEVNAEYFTTGRRSGQTGVFQKLFQPFRDAVRLFRKLGSSHYEVIHLNPSLNRKAILRDSLFMFVFKVRKHHEVLVFFRGWDPGYMDSIRSSRFRCWFFRAMFGNAKQILVLASQFRSELEDLGFEGKKITVFSTMFDGSQLQQDVDVYEKQGKSILFLSRFVVEKGIYELLQGFADIVEEFPSVQLIMAGGGPEENNAKQWVKEHSLEESVIFPGYLRGKDKAGTLTNSDIFILPTYHGEGCPNAILEAMGAGMPVVTSSVGGIPDIITDGVNGILLGEVASHEIADALRCLLSDQDLSDRMGSKNRKIAWEQYESLVVTRRLETIYQQLVVQAQ